MPDNIKNIKVYHIIHVDRLDSILSDGYLLCDAEVKQRQNTGTTIGMAKIKERRLHKNLTSFENLTVGECVPFYFCPRSVMLYVINCKNNPDLEYSNGQDDIIHLVFNLQKILDWAKHNNLRTCFSTSNAGSYYFEDYSDFDKIIEMLDWESINALQWSGSGINECTKENKQAEFLIENKLSINLLDSIGVYNLLNYSKVCALLSKHKLCSKVAIKKEWYY